MTKDELLEERARLQYIINQAYKDGGGTYEGAARAYGSKFNDIVNRRDAINKLMAKVQKQEQPASKLISTAPQKISIPKIVPKAAKTTMSSGSSMRYTSTAYNPVLKERKKVAKAQTSGWFDRAKDAVKTAYTKWQDMLEEAIPIPQKKVNTYWSNARYAKFMASDASPIKDKAIRDNLKKYYSGNRPLYIEDSNSGKVVYWDESEQKVKRFQATRNAGNVGAYRHTRTEPLSAEEITSGKWHGKGATRGVMSIVGPHKYAWYKSDTHGKNTMNALMIMPRFYEGVADTMQVYGGRDVTPQIGTNPYGKSLHIDPPREDKKSLYSITPGCSAFQNKRCGDIGSWSDLYEEAMQHIDAGNNPLYAVYSNIFRR